MGNARCRFRPRTHRTAWTAAWLTLACLGAGCDRMVNRQYSRDFGDLSGADRIEVTTSYEEGTLVATIADRQRVAAVAAFAGRYRDGWINALSANPADRYVAFYAGERLLAKIGVAARGLTSGEYFRQLTPAEVAELVNLLGIPWPPPENPPGTPRPDRVP